MVIRAPYVARRCEPGQFIILRVDDEGEQIPLRSPNMIRKGHGIDHLPGGWIHYPET